MANRDKLFRDITPYVTSGFGMRTLNGKTGFHLGVDYGTDGKKVPCYALDDGYVVRTWRDDAGALGVDVAYPNLGKVGVYVHLDKILVSKGQNVNKGTQIGITGMTGYATGVHLHFGWYDISDINVTYLKRRWSDFEQFDFNNVVIRSNFLGSRGWLTFGDKGENIRKICDFMYRVFPAYDKTLKMHKEGLLGDVFGPYLKAWIIEFQKRTNLEPDGNIGPLTLAKLKEYGFKE